MKNNPTLPCNITELQRMNVDWKAITNGFDFDTVNNTIKLWSKPEERCVVARMIGNQMSVGNLNGLSAKYVQLVVDLLTMYQYKEGSDKYKLLEQLVSERLELHKREELKRMKMSNKSLTKEVEELKKQLKEKKEEMEAMYEGLAALDEIQFKLKETEDRASSLQYMYEKELEENKLLRGLINEKPNNKKFSVRQTAIVAHALCKKANVLPRNKKNISQLFNYMTGCSANTLGQNMCSSYNEDEIEKIANEIEDKLPEFAAYLREGTFFLPEKK